jgi:hypothetical protein
MNIKTGLRCGNMTWDQCASEFDSCLATNNGMRFCADQAQTCIDSLNQ